MKSVSCKYAEKPPRVCLVFYTEFPLNKVLSLSRSSFAEMIGGVYVETLIPLAPVVLEFFSGRLSFKIETISLFFCSSFYSYSYLLVPISTTFKADSSDELSSIWIKQPSFSYLLVRATGSFTSRSVNYAKALSVSL